MYIDLHVFLEQARKAIESQVALITVLNPHVRRKS